MVQGVSGNNNIPHNPDYDVKNKKNENEVQVFANEPQEVQTEQAKPAKPLEAYQIDYSAFAKKERADAKEFAEEKLADLRKVVNQFNLDFPKRQYVIDYSSFPKPENFTQYKKNEAFDAWKDSVKKWVSARQDEVAGQRSYNLQHVSINIAAGFGALGAQLGFSTEFIAAKLEELGGDVNKLNNCLKKTQQAIIANDNRNAKEIMNQAVALFVIGEATANRRTEEINNNIVNESENIQETITETSKETNGKIDRLIFTEELEAHKEAEAKKFKAEIYRAWNNNQNATKRVIDKVLRMEGKEYVRTHFTDATQSESASATNGMIENLELNTLRRIHYNLRLERLLD